MDFQAFVKADLATATTMLAVETNIDMAGEDGFQTILQCVLGSHWTEPKHRLEKLNLLLSLGASPNLVTQRDDAPPLLKATQLPNGDEYVRVLIAAKADLNVKNYHGVTPVMGAVGSGSISIVRTLVEAGASIDDKDDDGNTALMLAINSDKHIFDIIKYFVDSSANVNLQYKQGMSCLSKALMTGKNELVKPLLEAGADVNHNDVRGRGALSNAVATEKCSLETIKALVEAGAVVDNIDTEGKTALFAAIARDNKEITQYLVSCGASVHTRGKDGMTLLMTACKSGSFMCVPQIIKAGADIEAKGPDKMTALMFAVANEKCTKAMLAGKADVHARDKDENTALMHAVTGGWGEARVGVVTQLIKNGSDVCASNSEGMSALHRAVSGWNNAALVGALIDFGANPNSCNKKSQTPLMLCRAVETAEELLKHSPLLDLKDSDGQSALIYAALTYADDDAILKALIKAGAAVSLADNSGMTALMRTVVSKPKCSKLLIAAGASLDAIDNKKRSVTSYAGSDSLRILIQAGAKPHESEWVRLEAALREDDIPLAIILLERGIRTGPLGLDSFMRYKKSIEKIARSRAQLLATGIDCMDGESKNELNKLLAKFAANQSPDIADDGQLPAVLRSDGWPIKSPNRKQIVVAPNTFEAVDYFQGTVNWKDSDEKDSCLSDFKRRASKWSDEDDLKVKEMISGYLVKPVNMAWKDLIAASDELFLQIWNAHADKLISHIRSNYQSIDSDHIRYILARFELAALPGTLRAIGEVQKFAEALKQVDSPACAAVMSRWMSEGSQSRLARRWALSYPHSCARGLMATATTGKPGKERNMAEAALRHLVFNGHRELVENIAAEFGPAVSASIKEILCVDPRNDFMPKKAPEMPKFWSADVYPAPRLRDGGKALPPHAIEALASMMSVSSAENWTPALDEVIAACDPKSLSNFAWSAFEEWAKKGKKDSEWIFNSLAYFGDDECARKLTPYIREWPKLNGQLRALQGLRILSCIGSDVALSQIQAVSLKNKYESVLNYAKQMMEEIAKARNLTPQQFEDRLVPDLGLSETGTIKLGFGSRYFTGAVDAQLKPIIVDELGALVKTLPAPAKNDDKTLAKESLETWSGFCKDLKVTAKLQLERFELAMVNSRRWSGDDFKRLLIASPLLQSLVRGLVWGVFAKKGNPSETFVVTAKGECLDADGKAVKISDTTQVGIVHPLMMEVQIGAWQKLFTRNKQSQPFAQLVRKAYRAKDDSGNDLFGLEGATVPSKALKGLKAMGWHTEVGDGGWIWSFYRGFPSGQVSITVEPGVHMTDYEYDGHTEQKLSVDMSATLNEIEFSELVRELQTLRK